MRIESLITRLTKGQSTNSTDGSFSVANSRPTTTKPAGSATRTIIDRTDVVSADQTTLKLLPYGGNDNNDIINVKVNGWNRLPRQSGLNVDLWVAQIVCEIQGTLSSSLPGIAAQAVVATEYFCDTITLTKGNAVLYNGTADVDVAWIQCDVGSFELIEVTGDLGAGGDTMNWLYGW